VNVKGGKELLGGRKTGKHGTEKKQSGGQSTKFDLLEKGGAASKKKGTRWPTKGRKEERNQKRGGVPITQAHFL